MSKTKGELAIEVFDALAMNDGLTEPTVKEVEYVMKRIEQMVATWERKGIFVNYKYADPTYGPDTNSESGIVDTDEAPVVMNAAVLCAPKFGRSASQDVKAQAKEGYELLFSIVLPQRQQSIDQPSGQGNNYWGNPYSSYMPDEEQITIPDDGILTL